MPMTPEKERELMEKMAEAAEAEMKKPRMHVNYTPCDKRMELCIGLRAALSIAAPILRDEVLEEVALLFRPNDIWQGAAATSTIRSLKTINVFTPPKDG
jgi:hypothetical protein